MENWRKVLARNIALRNSDLSVRELNTAVQRIIDRIIFLRIAEDRGIETYGQLQALIDKKCIYKYLTKLFLEADDRYNSGLFHFRDNDGLDETLDTFTLDLSIDDKTLKPVLKSLYFPESPYEFSVLPINILGQAYERFLGKIIKLSDKRRAVISEKPEVRKAGGVYYTPTYIVQYIVENTIGPILKRITPSQASGIDKRIKEQTPLRILDPACGSGSFLIEAYQYLLDWYRDQYVKQGPQKHTKGRDPKLYQVTKDDWRLSIAERQRILLTHIYGVDIDPQAVEVTKLSLLLKVLEGETADAIARQMDFFSIRALPDLGENIKCGNSLISSEFFSQIPSSSLFSEDDQYRINIFDWLDEFLFLKQSRGFAVVLGNPPWISLTGKFRNEIYSKYEREYLISRYNGNSNMPNMYEYFISKGLELVAPSGYFSFIVPDRFGYNDQFIELRKKILNTFRLDEIKYRAPFPNITTDTAIFVISARPTPKNHEVRIGNFGGQGKLTPLSKLKNDSRVRYEYVGDDQSSEIVDKIINSENVKPLKEIVKTTSGVGAKSSSISPKRASARQIRILKGASIGRYEVKQPLFFDFKPANITGRTTDENKLGFSPKILIRKTGNKIIAAYDDSGIYPEQSLYFTYDHSTEPLFYLLGFLNSKLMQFIFFNTAITNRDSIAQVKKVDLDNLPIRIVNSEDGEKSESVKIISDAAWMITDLTNQLRAEKNEQSRINKNRRIKYAEQKIDAAVFSLFNLSIKEKEYVENWVSDGALKHS